MVRHSSAGCRRERKGDWVQIENVPVPPPLALDDIDDPLDLLPELDDELLPEPEPDPEPLEPEPEPEL